MIRGIGTDIIEIGRIREAMDRHGPHFLGRILTEAEIQFCLAKAHPEAHVAARFAAKEAVAKALGCGIGAMLSWHDIAIHSEASGKPVLHFTNPEAAERHGNPTILISLSHSREYATATAVVEDRG